MQFEKPLDEDEETDEELPEDSNPIMDIMEKNLSSSNNGGRHITLIRWSISVPKITAPSK